VNKHIRFFAVVVLRRRIGVSAYYRQSEMFFARPIVRAAELTTVVAAVNQYQ
jgi:hypothetical protein